MTFMESGTNRNKALKEKMWVPAEQIGSSVDCYLILFEMALL